MRSLRKLRRKKAKSVARTAVSSVGNFWSAILTPAKRSSRSPKKTVRSTKSSTAPIKKRASLTSRSAFTVPRGATFEDGTISAAFGRRSYKLYVPTIADQEAGPLPLVVMLHGCGQSANDFARGTGMNALAEQLGFYVLYPTQSRTAHVRRCWNWFKSEDQMRGAGEPALIAAITLEIIAEQAIDPAKVYVAGLSAGAAAALVLATTYPDIFAAVGAHSGLAVGAAHSANSATRAMQGGNPGRRHGVKMPTILFHGESDQVVNPRNSRFAAMRALEPFEGLQKTEKIGHTFEGHGYVRTMYRIGRGRPYVEHWVVRNAGHAWSGGHSAGSYTDPKGPDASREMIRFFLAHRTTKKRRSYPKN